MQIEQNNDLNEPSSFNLGNEVLRIRADRLKQIDQQRIEKRDKQKSELRARFSSIYKTPETMQALVDPVLEKLIKHIPAAVRNFVRSYPLETVIPIKLEYSAFNWGHNGTPVAVYFNYLDNQSKNLSMLSKQLINIDDPQVKKKADDLSKKIVLKLCRFEQTDPFLNKDKISDDFWNFNPINFELQQKDKELQIKIKNEGDFLLSAVLFPLLMNKLKVFLEANSLKTSEFSSDLRIHYEPNDSIYSRDHYYYRSKAEFKLNID